MVLSLKRWKSRSPPGFAAGAGHGSEPIHMSFEFAESCSAYWIQASGAARLRKAERPPELMRGKPSERRLAPAIEATSSVAGWSSPVARQAHNLKVVGSNPTPATNKRPRRKTGPFVVSALQSFQRKLESHLFYRRKPKGSEIPAFAGMTRWGCRSDKGQAFARRGCQPPVIPAKAGISLVLSTQAQRQ